MPTIRLKTSDERIIHIDEEIARCSGTIQDMLNDIGREDVEEKPLFLEYVNESILQTVIKWMKFHMDDRPPADDDENKNTPATLSSFDIEFFNVDKSTLFQLVLAANYLDIDGLFDISCERVADMIKGKSTEEMRGVFNSRTISLLMS